MSVPAKILIIRLSSLGDILHTLPAFQSLRSTFPNAHIGWLVERRMSFLLSAVPGIDSVHILDTITLRQQPGDPAIWRETFNLVREVRAVRYDLSLDFQGLLKTAFLSLICGAQLRLGFPRGLTRENPAHWFYHRAVSPPPGQLHVTELNRRLAEAAGAQSPAGEIKLNVPAADSDAIRSRLQAENLGRYVVINPGGGWLTKKWAPTNYGELARRIQAELDLPVVVTTGPGEEGIFKEIVRCCPDPPPRHFAVPFLQLIPLFRQARLLIGGDTGPFHLACALGTPVVGIFGPTAPARNGPWSDVDESVTRMLPCSFCNRRKCPTQNECMEIAVADVFSAVVRRLKHVS